MRYRTVGQAYRQITRREIEKVRADAALHSPGAAVVYLQKGLILLGLNIVLIEADVVVDKLDAGENIVAYDDVAAVDT